MSYKCELCKRPINYILDTNLRICRDCTRELIDAANLQSCVAWKLLVDYRIITNQKYMKFVNTAKIITDKGIESVKELI